MKTVFMASDSCGAKYLADGLSKNGFLDAIILERGTKKTKRKALKKIKSAGWLWFPVKVFDFFAVYLYSKLCNRFLVRNILVPNDIQEYPGGAPVYRVDDASGSLCISILKTLRPDIIVVFGTSILKPEVLEIPSKYA
ncbi:MAG: hypothetical protein V3U37_07335, partial [Nitrospinaceae bacterium]